MPDLPISGLQEKTTGFDPSDLLVIEDGTATKKVQIGVLFVAASSVPNVSSVSPNLLQNTGNQTITVTGSGFSSSDIISVSGAMVVSSNFIDENTIEIVIDTDSTAGGTYTVTVTNSTNGGQGSGTFDVLGYVTEDIEFTSFSLTDTVTINGKDNNLRKPSSSGNGWTGDARSMKGITQGNGKIEFTLISGGV
ncbi:MAG: IPT/TIG domain-containing protein, partial [Saprospiraceae bacterium]